MLATDRFHAVLPTNANGSSASPINPSAWPVVKSPPKSSTSDHLEPNNPPSRLHSSSSVASASAFQSSASLPMRRTVSDSSPTTALADNGAATKPDGRGFLDDQSLTGQGPSVRTNVLDPASSVLAPVCSSSSPLSSAAASDLAPTSSNSSRPAVQPSPSQDPSSNAFSSDPMGRPASSPSFPANPPLAAHSAPPAAAATPDLDSTSSPPCPTSSSTVTVPSNGPPVSTPPGQSPSPEHVVRPSAFSASAQQPAQRLEREDPAPVQSKPSDSSSSSSPLAHNPAENLTKETTRSEPDSMVTGSSSSSSSMNALPHLDLATYPPQELVKLLASLLQRIATANDALRASEDENASMSGGGESSSASTPTEEDNVATHNGQETAWESHPTGNGEEIESGREAPVHRSSTNTLRPPADVEMKDRHTPSGSSSSWSSPRSTAAGLAATAKNTSPSCSSKAPSSAYAYPQSSDSAVSSTPATPARPATTLIPPGPIAILTSATAQALQQQHHDGVTSSSSSFSTPSYPSSSSTASNDTTSIPIQPTSSSLSPAPNISSSHPLLAASLSAFQSSSSSLCFHARNVPGISIEVYLLRILKYCPASNEVFLSLLVYFDRMSRLSMAVAGRPFAIDSFNVHRLVIAGVTVASKFFSGEFFAFCLLLAFSF